MSYPLVRIADIAEVNPGINELQELPASLEVSFVPMQAVSELTATIEQREIRKLSEVRKGFTPFLENDVLIAKITPSMENGKAALARYLVNGIGFGSTEFHILRPSYLVLPEYLYYFVRQPSFRAAAKQRMRGAAGQQRVPDNFFYTYFIPLPPLSEQRRIVTLLCKADELRQKRREAQREAQALLPALFEEMFDPHVGKQKGWGTKPIQEFGDVQYGITLNSAKRSTGDGYPYLRVANVQRDQIDVTDIAEIKADVTELERFQLQEKDVLVVEGHADRTEIGRAAVWYGEIAVCLHQNHILRIRPFEGIASPNYLAAYINSSTGRDYMFRHSKTSSGLYTINSKDLNTMPVPAAPPELQVAFEQRLLSTKALFDRNVRSVEYLEALFSSLLARAFRGELTAAWRERHGQQLAAEVTQRDQLLAQHGVAQPQTTTQLPMLETSDGESPTIAPRGSRDEFIACLSEEQQRIWQAVQEHDDYFNVETFSQSYDLPLARARQTLDLLALAGLLVPVSLWNSEISDFVTAYRRLRQTRDDAERGDESYADDIMLLETE